MKLFTKIISDDSYNYINNSEKQLDNQPVEQVISFNYLGVTNSSDRQITKELEHNRSKLQSFREASARGDNSTCSLTAKFPYVNNQSDQFELTQLRREQTH